jgi:hypothetical protein
MFKKQEDPPNPFKKFLEAFLGQEVELFTGIMQKLEMTDMNGQTTIEEIPCAVRGIVLDIDDKFIYLGETKETISKVVGYGTGIIVEVVKQTTEFDDILDNMSIAIGDKGN